MSHMQALAMGAFGLEFVNSLPCGQGPQAMSSIFCTHILPQELLTLLCQG